MKEDKLYKRSKSNMIISNLVRIALIILYVRGWIVSDHSQDFLIILTFAMTYYPSVLEKRFGVYLPNGLQIVITLFIFASQVLGEMRGFYTSVPWWDLMLHTISGTVLGMIGFLFVYLLNEKGDANVNLSPIFVILFAFCFALAIGVFWEFFEYGSDRLLGYNMQRFRLPGEDGLVDTMNDLIVDAVGAGIACIVGWIYIKQQNDTLFNNFFDKWFISEVKKNEKAKNKENEEDVKL